MLPSPEVCERPAVEHYEPHRGGLLRSLLSPIDIAPLIFFRVTFGLLMLIEIAAYTFSGYLAQHWISPKIHFTYYGFGWVIPPGESGMYALAAVLMLSAIGVMLGFFYRTSATVLTLGLTWLFLIEQANYLNHFYLICLLAGVAIFLPANRAASIDCLRNPALRTDVAPAWTLWILQGHMAMVYLYGGIAKINVDWLNAGPIRVWFTDGVPAGRVPTFLKQEIVYYLVSYSGLLLDLLVVPLLLWKKTRPVALAFAIVFHLGNFWLFNIGVFPFLAIALTLLFVDSAWHRKILRLGSASGLHAATPIQTQKWLFIPLAIYVALQMLFPFRHWLYPGPAHWTEEGHRFAWRMMLRSKTGDAYFIIPDENGKLWRINPNEILTRRQYLGIVEHPDMLLQFAHYLRDRAGGKIAVYAVNYVSLNGRPRKLLVDPEVDLAKVERNLWPADWILSLENQRSPPARYRFAKPASIRHFDPR